MAISDERLKALLAKASVPLTLDDPLDVLDDPLDVSEVAIAEAAPESPPEPTALELDRWGIGRGQRLLDDSARLQGLEHLGEGDEQRSHAVADFYGAAFQLEPTLNERCADQKRRDFVESLLGQSEYAAMHAMTALDVDASDLAAIAFAEQYENLMEEKKKKDREREEKRKKGDKGDPGREEMEDAIATARAACRACEHAKADVEAHHDSKEACGMGPGGPANASPERIAAFFEKVKKSAKLKRIFELAGKFRRLARSKQRLKLVHGYDDLVGVDLSRDLSRVMPAEFVALRHPALRLDFLRRYAESQLMSLDYRAVEPVGAGPVIVCIDQSGSMGGVKGETAMAVALAMAWIASRQKRWCALLAFTGQERDWRDLVGERSAHHNLLLLPNGRWSEDAMLSWLSSFLGDGSNHDVPVRELPKLYDRIGAPAGKTDVILVTDAECCLTDPEESVFNNWKARAKARVISLVVGGASGKSLGRVSDELYAMSALSTEEEGVGSALSI